MAVRAACWQPSVPVVAACGRQTAAAAAAVRRAPMVAADPARSTRACRCRAHRAPQSEAVINGEKLALQKVGGKVGKLHDQVQVARRLHRADGQVGRGPDRRPNARKAAPGQEDDRLPRRVQLGRDDDLAADPQPGRHPAGLARRTPYVGLTTSARAPSPASRTKYYPTGKRTYAPRRPARHHPGCRAASRHEGRRLQERLHPERQGGLRQGPRATRSRRRRSAGHQGRSATTASTPKAANYRSLASKIKCRAPTASSSAASPTTTASQLFKDVTAANPDAKLYGPDGVAEAAFSTKEVPRPTCRRTLHHRRDAVDPKRATRRRARSSSRTTSRSTARTPDPYAIYGYEAMDVDPRRDQARRRQGQRPPGRHRRDLHDQGHASPCSARTRSTRTATPR